MLQSQTAGKMPDIHCQTDVQSDLLKVSLPNWCTIWLIESGGNRWCRSRPKHPNRGNTNKSTIYMVVIDGVEAGQPSIWRWYMVSKQVNILFGGNRWCSIRTTTHNTPKSERN